jgi:dTDP-4-dehydrorhamnose reductase
MNADILLTGANGQLGFEVTRRAAAHGLTVFGVDVDELDIRDADAVRRMVAAIAPKVVVNAAAHTAVDRAESEVDLSFAVNRDGPANLAAACADAGIGLVHVSTDYVFDGAKTTPWVEDDPIAPLGVYGASKAAGEAAVRSALPAHVILRTAWVYGVHGANFVKTMLRVGKTRDRLTVVDDQHGCPTHAGDLAEAILTISRRMVDGTMPADGWGTFHCSGQGATTWCGFAREIFRRAAPRLARVPEVAAIPTSDYPTPAKRPANSVLDCERLARVHGIRLRPWPEALAEVLAETPIEDL